MTRRRSRRGGVLAAALLLSGALGLYLWSFRGGENAPAGAGAAAPRMADDARPITKLAANFPDAETPGPSRAESTDSPSSPRDPAPARESASTPGASLAHVDQLIEAGDLVEARRQLSVWARRGSASPPDEGIVARMLELAEETIFSARVFPNDPLVATHVLSSGEVLARIADRYKISPELLASINNIPDMNRVRVGQRLKVVNGPLHAVVYKSTFELLVYAGDILVARFPVGLGAEGSTPTGVWQVTEKLTNPTYYPPRGGAVVAADDPENPLGEHWIALKGIEGDAVGQMGYGIHGTNEPHTIGRNESLGCIRLRNEDVARLYTMLARNDSTVTIVD